jgi:putative hemolysin
MEIAVIALLIVFNGLLAMSEIALISSRKARLQQRAEAGDAGAVVALELASQPNRFLSTVQIGITLVGILAGAFGGATIARGLAGWLAGIALLAPYREPLAFGVVVVLITYFSLVFGELVPKRLALMHPERIAAATSRLMALMSRMASPAVHLMSVSTDVVFKVVGLDPRAEVPVTEEEIKLLVRQGTSSGAILKLEEEMVMNVFRLGDRSVTSVMTHRPDIIWIDVNDPTAEIAGKFADAPHNRFPVCDGTLDAVVGLVRSKDLLAELLAGRQPDLRRVARPPLFVPENVGALRVLEMFKQTGMHLAIVIDEYGAVQGLVTHHDIIEAVVGDIPSVGLPVELSAVPRGDGSWLFDGTIPVDEFQETLKLTQLEPEDEMDYQTLAGFVMKKIGRIPVAGDHFDWVGYRFEVVDMDGRRVDKVLVAPLKN